MQGSCDVPDTANQICTEWLFRVDPFLSIDSCQCTFGDLHRSRLVRSGNTRGIICLARATAVMASDMIVMRASCLIRGALHRIAVTCMMDPSNLVVHLGVLSVIAS